MNQITDTMRCSIIDYYQKPSTLKKIVKIQSWFRGNLYRIKHLPIILYIIKKHLNSNQIICSNATKDGRINSCLDEEKIIECISEKFKNRIKIPKIRMWYDVLIKDYVYGWLPVNIKTTTTLTHDNIGNLAPCVYAYTDEKLSLESNKSYDNGNMSRMIIKKIKEKKYNKNHKKDYYFIVVNKNKPTQVIINSLKGLHVLTPNINNLPFQICWNKNKTFIYKKIQAIIKQFVNCIKKPNPSWKETFLTNIRAIQSIEI
jgi:hypothetical protein